MKAVPLSELRELLQGAPFAAWWTEWSRTVSAASEARVRHQDLVSQSELMALRSELARRAAGDLLAAAAEAEHQAAAAAAEAQVHQATRSFERSLLAAEHGQRAPRIRRAAERLLGEAEERRERAKQLRVQADGAGREVSEATVRREALLARASTELGCLAGEGWLYFRDPSDERAAYAIALADEPDGAPIEVKALAIYTVGHPRGVAFLEPAREGTEHRSPAGLDGAGPRSRKRPRPSRRPPAR
jgi:hypothetical protein